MFRSLDDWRLIRCAVHCSPERCLKHNALHNSIIIIIIRVGCQFDHIYVFKNHSMTFGIQIIFRFVLFSFLSLSQNAYLYTSALCNFAIFCRSVMVVNDEEYHTKYTRILKTFSFRMARSADTQQYAHTHLFSAAVFHIFTSYYLLLFGMDFILFYVVFVVFAFDCCYFWLLLA